MVSNEKCTCGSGAHPRRCKKHPWRFDTHVISLNADLRSEMMDEAIERIMMLERKVFGKVSSEDDFPQTGGEDFEASLCDDLEYQKYLKDAMTSLGLINFEKHLKHCLRALVDNLKNGMPEEEAIEEASKKSIKKFKGKK